MTALATALHQATPTQWHKPMPFVEQRITPFQALLECVKDYDDLCSDLSVLLATPYPEAARMRETLAKIKQPEVQ